jgi:hypothetical protein
MTRKSTITIEVTEDDIRRAERNNSFHCVVAQAVARTISDATNIDVDTQSIRFSVPVNKEGRCERWLYWTPYRVQQYIIDYDAGEHIEPFAFMLRSPERRESKRNAANGLTKDARAKRENAYRRAKREALRKGASAQEAADAGRRAYAEAAGKHIPPPVGPVASPAASEDLITRRLPPRGTRRTYGGRILRINRDEVK